MNTNSAHALINSMNAKRSSFYQSANILDALKANLVDRGEAATRVRKQARQAEHTLLVDIKRLIDAVVWVNEEIHDAAVRREMIEKSSQQMELTDSAMAMIPARQEAEAALVELTNLRTGLLRMVISVASTLTPRDGRTIAADIGTETLFPGGPDLFAEPEPDAVSAMVEGVDRTRRDAGQRGSHPSDEEFAALIGAF